MYGFATTNRKRIDNADRCPECGRAMEGIGALRPGRHFSVPCGHPLPTDFEIRAGRPVRA